MSDSTKKWFEKHTLTLAILASVLGIFGGVINIVVGSIQLNKETDFLTTVVSIIKGIVTYLWNEPITMGDLAFGYGFFRVIKFVTKRMTKTKPEPEPEPEP